ncbi:MAG: hypothetical protein ABIB47_03345, partial [Candidatus Woesearchaeota archaeon]
MKRTFLIIAVVIFISLTQIVSAAVWKYGTLHVHTGYSSQTGYDHDILTTEDNCPKETLNWHGYTVAELKEQ